MQVITTDDDSSLHLDADDATRQDTSTNAYVAGKWAFFVDVCAIDGFSWSLEAQAYIFVPSLLHGKLPANASLLVLEEVLLLVCLLNLVFAAFPAHGLTCVHRGKE